MTKVARIILADDDASFFDAAVRLLSNDGLWGRRPPLLRS